MEITGQRVNLNPVNSDANQAEQVTENKEVAQETEQAPEIELNLRDIANLPSQLNSLAGELKEIRKELKENRQALDNYKPRLKIIDTSSKMVNNKKEHVKEFFKNYL